MVGGAIRDSLLNLPTNNSDIDLVIDMKNGGICFATFFAIRNGCFVKDSNPVIFHSYGTAKFELYNNEEFKGIKIECVQTRKEQYHSDSRNPSTFFGTIEEDAKRRDFTINSLYYNISKGSLHDFNGGVRDLTNCNIKTTANPDIIFFEDPLRMMRAIRFSTKLGWDIEKETWLGIVKNAHRINIVSQERISDELSKILLSDKPSIGIRKLYYSGLLDKIMPDIYESTLAYDSKDVSIFEHTMKVVDAVQPILENRLAALFHDVGRIIANKIKDDSLDKFSADIAVYDLKIMKYPNHIVKSVETAIKYHRAFKNYKEEKLPRDGKIRQFINLTKGDLTTTIDLMHANNVHSSTNKKKTQALNIVKRIEELINTENANEVKLPINGNDIIKEFKLKASPLIGTLLNLVKDAYFENPNITKKEALETIKKHLAT